MSEKEKKLQEIRQKKLEQLKQQAAQQQSSKQRQQELESKKFQMMRKILSQKGRQRLENIRMVKPQFAQQIEMQLLQLYKMGKLRGSAPLSDKKFKKLLKQLQKKQKKTDFKIKKF
ncbi:MAG: DNA-binding protein [Promethearchaeia archaeon]